MNFWVFLILNVPKFVENNFCDIFFSQYDYRSINDYKSYNPKILKINKITHSMVNTKLKYLELQKTKIKIIKNVVYICTYLVL